MVGAIAIPHRSSQLGSVPPVVEREASRTGTPKALPVATPRVTINPPARSLSSARTAPTQEPPWATRASSGDLGGIRAADPGAGPRRADATREPVRRR